MSAYELQMLAIAMTALRDIEQHDRDAREPTAVKRAMAIIARSALTKIANINALRDIKPAA